MAKNNVSDLLKIKEKMQNNENLVLCTKNKNNDTEGVALLWTNSQNMISVFEGREDGSEDKEFSFEEFLLNYSYELK